MSGGKHVSKRRMCLLPVTGRDSAPRQTPVLWPQAVFQGRCCFILGGGVREDKAGRGRSQEKMSVCSPVCPGCSLHVFHDHLNCRGSRNISLPSNRPHCNDSLFHPRFRFTWHCHVDLWFAHFYWVLPSSSLLDEVCVIHPGRLCRDLSHTPWAFPGRQWLFQLKP